MRVLSALALLPLCCAQALATPLGNLQQATSAPSQVLLTTDNQMQLQVSLLSDQVFRLQAGKIGAFASEGNKAAPIVLPGQEGQSVSPPPLLQPTYIMLTTAADAVASQAPTAESALVV